MHNRDGIIDFGSDRVEHVKRGLMWSVGISAGRNFRLLSDLRIAVPIQFEYGKALEDTVSDLILVDGTRPLLELNSIMYHLGIEPLIQFPIRCAPRLWFYLAAGGGIHYSALTEELSIINDNRHRRVEGDPRLEEGKNVILSATAGGGFEFTLSPYSGLYINYLFRFWQPVRRKTSRDLFPLYAKPYRELFFSNTVSIGIHFSRER